MHTIIILILNLKPRQPVLLVHSHIHYQDSTLVDSSLWTETRLSDYPFRVRVVVSIHLLHNKQETAIFPELQTQVSSAARELHILQQIHQLHPIIIKPPITPPLTSFFRRTILNFRLQGKIRVVLDLLKMLFISFRSYYSFVPSFCGSFLLLLIWSA